MSDALAKMKAELDEEFRKVYHTELGKQQLTKLLHIATKLDERLRQAGQQLDPDVAQWVKRIAELERQLAAAKDELDKIGAVEAERNQYRITLHQQSEGWIADIAKYEEQVRSLTIERDLARAAE